MTLCKLDLANLNNLTAFWRVLGATQQLNFEPPLWTSDSWPHKCWSAPEAPQTPIDTDSLHQMDGRLIFPLWGLSDVKSREAVFQDIGYTISSEQTAMVLSSSGRTSANTAQNNVDLRPLNNKNDADLWSRICAEAFGYPIDPAPIRMLIQDADAGVFLATIDEEAAATAVLYRTRQITGIHQVGVLPAFRGQGLARTMMESTIDHAFRSGAQHITLQASPAGKPLYDQLGFREQFEIRNYSRGPSQ